MLGSYLFFVRVTPTMSWATSNNGTPVLSFIHRPLKQLHRPERIVDEVDGVAARA
jgi:hypothetical protein